MLHFCHRILLRSTMSQHSHNNGTPQGICYNYTMSLQCRINADARKGIQGPADYVGQITKNAI